MSKRAKLSAGEIAARMVGGSTTTKPRAKPATRPSARRSEVTGATAEAKSPTPKPAATTKPRAQTERVDSAALLDDARRHVADDPGRALGSVLAAWRATRAPRLAAICHRVGALVDRPPLAVGKQKAMHDEWLAIAAHRDPADVPRLLAALTSGSGKHAAERIAALAWAVDPRVAAAIASFLETMPYRGSAGVRPTAVASERHHAFETAEVRPLTASVERACQDLEALLDQHRSGDELLTAILDAPDEDGPREVYADWLLDRGDPRGDFIALQLSHRRAAPSEDTGKRERVLLRAHEKAWLGTLASVTKNRVWDRGFLVACDLAGNARTLRMIADDPLWRTVERIVLDELVFTPDDFLCGPSFVGLRDVSGANPKVVAALFAGPVRPRLARLSTSAYHGEGLAVLFQEPRGVPALRALGLEGGPTPAELGPLWKTPHGARIEELSVELGLDDLAAWLAALADVPQVQRLVFVTRSSVAREAGTLEVTRSGKRWRLLLDAGSEKCVWRDPVTSAIRDLTTGLAATPRGAIDDITIALNGAPREPFELALGPHAPRARWR